MKKITRELAIIMILLFLTGITSFAATSQTITGSTSGGGFGYAQTTGICDGGDHYWPTVDDVHCRTQADKTIYVYVAATIYGKSGWSSSNSGSNTSGSVYIQVNGQDTQASYASASHTVQSQDYGNWSGNTSCSYN